MRASLSPETILSVKVSDSLLAPRFSSAIGSSVVGSERVWDVVSSLIVLFLTDVKSVASSSPDSALRKTVDLLSAGCSYQYKALFCLVVPAKKNHLQFCSSHWLANKMLRQLTARGVAGRSSGPIPVRLCRRACNPRLSGGMRLLLHVAKIRGCTAD